MAIALKIYGLFCFLLYAANKWNKWIICCIESCLIMFALFALVMLTVYCFKNKWNKN